MPSSWVQHDTVVARQSRLQVADLFREAGRITLGEGKSPIRLADSGASWYVARGAVDLFLVDLRRGVPEGRLHHFVSVDAGDIALEVAPLPSLDPALSFGLLAVGVTGTRLLALPQKHLRARAHQSGCLDALYGA